MPTRVMIVDDVTLLRKGARLLLESDPAFVVVGEAESGPIAVEMDRNMSPELILMDIMMPGDFDGIEATRRILANVEPDRKRPVIVALSGSVNETAAISNAGATAFITKGRLHDLLPLLKKIVAEQADR